MPISEINSADDLAVLASEAVQQVRITKQYRDLVAAILMANHVADWHYQKDLGRNFDNPEKAQMKATYPKWDMLRKLANGAKHCKLQPQQTSVEWEHDDFWDSPAHVDSDGLDWFVEFDGINRSVTVLIESFLEEFSNHALRPR